MIGDRDIEIGLKDMQERHAGAPCPTFKESSSVSSLSILTVIGAALVDSINSCAIAVLLISMTALFVSGNKRRALLAGFAFTISIYISYFLFDLASVEKATTWKDKNLRILHLIAGIICLFWVC